MDCLIWLVSMLGSTVRVDLKNGPIPAGPQQRAISGLKNPRGSGFHGGCFKAKQLFETASSGQYLVGNQ